MSFAQEIHMLYKQKKAELQENRESIISRREKDISLFFQQEVKDGAVEKMKSRAEVGRPTANILQYEYNERFYVDADNKICRYINSEVSYPNYRINDVVMRDKVFNDLLQLFEKELSSDNNKIYFSRWKPRETMHVIEAIWGRNKYHNNSRTFRNHSTKPFVKKESEYIPIQRLVNKRMTMTLV